VSCVRACPLDELWVGEMRGITLRGQRVVLINEGGQVSAFADRCAHQGIPLSEGRLRDGVITCRVHEWQYDARTGEGINPCSAHLSRFPLEIRDGEIWVDVDVQLATVKAR
jgi:toluene monooxygenase system ferredoxin subunit